MCGISYSKVNFKIKLFNLKKSEKSINKFIESRKFDLALVELKKFRNNYVFISIIHNKNNVSSILNRLNKKISIINKQKFSQKKIDEIRDIKWVIETEIFFKIKRIIEFAKKNKILLKNQSIIFIRFLIYSLESMNYLESRGRDSLGFSINFLSRKKFDFTNKVSNKNEISFFLKKVSEKKYLFNLSIKFAKRIGASGENVSKILEIFQKKSKLRKIKFDELISFEIFAHTRWASVGDVNNSNAHPLIQKKNGNLNLCLMNGDINNYVQLKKNLIQRKKYQLNDNQCKNDMQPIPTLFYESKKKINDLTNGSYVLINYNSSEYEQFYIYKKGTQGLYYTLDEDNNFHFASDVYGLINKSNKFKIFKRNGTFKINKKFIIELTKSSFTKTNLSTVDLSKKSMDTFFLKEVSDTEIFLKRTIDKYLDFEHNKFKGLDSFFNAKLENLLVEKKIKNIIFTGMGSCYTAAVGISKYLNQKLNSIKHNFIKVEATIASEGSGFYLTDNMKDTIIIVIAQSGTTIDTNVFAKMAKDRGAYTFAIVNKKQGDVTYIVDKSLYLGNGRDIEMSVPSTKTYTCHLIAGFIFSEKIIALLNKSVNKNFFNSMKKIAKSNLVNSHLNRITSDLENFSFNPLKFNNWIVVYDDSFNSFSALEFRIKLSECCYKSIPYMHVSFFNNLNLKNTLVFYLTSTVNKIFKFEKTNYYVVISKINKKKKLKNLFNLQIKSEDFVEHIVEITIGIQLIAYNVAKMIDQNSQIINNKNLKDIKKFILDEKNLLEYVCLSKTNKRKFLIDRLKRPIDTIKHQAKTVTVGAIRSINQDERVNFDNNFTSKSKLNSTEFKGKFFNLKENVSIYANEKYDYEKYYIGNLIEYFNSTYKFNKYYKLINLSKKNSINKKNTSIKIYNHKIEIKNNKQKIFNTRNISSYNLLKSFSPVDKVSSNNENILQEAKKNMLENNLKYKINLKKVFSKFNNIKFLGSGINYLVAKKYAQFFTHIYNKTIAFDVIENHKHIDISSEPLILIFAANIERKGFQRDVFSEVEKFIAHDNQTIIFTNLGNNIFDNLISNNKFIHTNRVIKLPLVAEIYSPSIFDFYFERFIK